MTAPQFKAKIQELLNEGSRIENVIGNASISAMASEYAKGNFLNVAEDNFILPKTVLCAVLLELAWQYEPLSKEDKKKVAQIRKLVKIQP